MKKKTDIEDAYWKGYLQKQNEAVEICKICKYKAKANKYDSLVEKIKEKIDYIKEEGYWEFTTDRDSDKCEQILQELLKESGK